MNKKILVTGATGAQGGAVVKHLVENGATVKALLTESDNAEWFNTNNVEVVTGDFNNPDSLVNALKDVTDVSLVYPLIYDWDILRKYTSNWLYAFEKSNIQSVVFNTSLPLPPEKTGSIVADIKLEIFEKFNEAGLPMITLMPSFYLDNLTAPWSLPVIKEFGIVGYPLPGDAKFAWLSHHNLAKFTYSALLNKNLIGKTFPIGGDLLTGNEIAERLTKYLGKPITYQYQQPHDFKQFLLNMYPEEIASEISGIYANIAANTQPFQAFYNKDIIEEVFKINLQTFDDWIKTVNW